MKIGEIPANATIQIRVMKGEKKFECLAVVVATRDDGLFLTPIKHQRRSAGLLHVAAGSQQADPEPGA